jgi:hypothetical protein
MASPDLGTILGASGFAASLATILYAHGQLKAMRRQADETRRVALLDSSRELLTRYQDLRTRWLTHPSGLAGLLDVLPGLDAAIANAGDMQMYLLFRDMLDTFQDVFFPAPRGHRERRPVGHVDDQPHAQPGAGAGLRGDVPLRGAARPPAGRLRRVLWGVLPGRDAARPRQVAGAHDGFRSHAAPACALRSVAQ